MTPHDLKRKLTAILSADVKGYSLLMGDDEEWTVRTLNVYKEVIRSLVGQHRGRVVDSPGDNLLAEFASVVDAVQCAVEIQQVLRAKNALLPENRRMEFRIGINLGDVIEEGDAIYGDGVNIAARLEGLAEAGGICLSESAYQQIENKLPLRYRYVGEHKVKNIAKPVRVYRAQIEPDATPEKKAKLRRWRMAVMGFVIAVAVAAAGGTIWKFYLSPPPRREAASHEKITEPTPGTPSSTVPPSGDLMTKHETAPPSPGKVSRPAGLPAPKAQVTEKSVRSADNVRKEEEQSKNKGMTGRTEEALKEGERFKREIGRGTEEEASVGARSWFRKGYALRYRDWNNEEAMKAFDKAIEIDPHFASAYAGRAAIYNDWRQYQQALSESEQAIKLAPTLAWGFNTRGCAYIGLANYDKALEDLNRAMELDPNYAWPYCSRSWAYFMLKDYHRALEDANKALEMDPEFSNAYFRRGRAFAALNNLQDAMKDFDKAIELDPKYSWSFVQRGYTLLRLGQTEQAVEDFKKGARLGNTNAQNYLTRKGVQW